ncbi:prolyl aminopeptidase [[Mycoplasma] gypis]|uniref:Proline iminopeptidase n=1 Tax=[Mycoplasma] gypis TaxID=92404 RepID=A0ABZ2RQK6_9BACT|nr:prolyl aminopeptidase [[Mycoplasma] gypis]MBN0919500.1 prolyl aminopeptidase [[Mycoplasma] gypis]
MFYTHEEFEEYQIEKEGHVIFFQTSGNKKGIPVIFVHGGPGGGTSKTDTKYFDPKKYFVILFDQRGCGLSTPSANIENNTTQDLISDMESIRETLKIEKWVVFGGSWGTTLSLLYTQKHTHNVLELVLRGVFLCRQSDLEWLYGKNGAATFFTREYETFSKYAKTTDVTQLIDFYYSKIKNPDIRVSYQAAKKWADWEMGLVTLLPDPVDIPRVQDTINFSLLETHYFANKCFIEENQIIQNMDKIKMIPATIIHGRYDVDCRVSSAYELSKYFKYVDFQIIEGAGHSSREKGIAKALLETMEKIKTKYVL